MFRQNIINIISNIILVKTYSIILSLKFFPLFVLLATIFLKGCIFENNKEDPKETKIVIDRISPTSISNIGQSITIHYTYYLNAESSKPVKIQVRGLFGGTTGFCIALFQENSFYVNSTANTVSLTHTINTSEFLTLCNENNRKYSIQLSIVMDQVNSTTVPSNVVYFDVGNPLIGCVGNQFKTIKLEHDITKTGNIYFDFKKTSNGDINNDMSKFNSTFQNSRVNLNFVTPDGIVEVSSTYWDVENDFNKMRNKL